MIRRVPCSTLFPYTTLFRSGLAFQIWDDVLDVEGNTSALGKSQGKDQENNKPTYPALLGLEVARKKAYETVETAKGALQQLDADVAVLTQLADYKIGRAHV